MTQPSQRKGRWKEITLGWLFVGGVLTLIYFSQQYQKRVGAFAIKAGSATILTENVVGENLLPDNEGREFRDVRPTRIDAPRFIECEVLSTYSGGYYLNFSWAARSNFKYRVSASRDAPKGKYTVNIEFASGYRHSISFSVE